MICIWRKMDNMNRVPKVGMKDEISRMRLLRVKTEKTTKKN